MKKYINLGCIISVCLYTLINFIKIIYQADWLMHLLSVSGLLVLLFSLLHISLQRLLLPLFIIMITVIVHITSIDESIFQYVWEGIRQMHSLIALLVIVPIVSWVLEEERYIEEVVASLRNILKSSKLFFVSMISITQIISYFLLFGAIPIVYQFIQSILKNKRGDEWESYKSTAVLRGFALSSIWVISMPSFVFAVESSGASLAFTILQGFFISISGICISVLFVYFKERFHGINLSIEIQEEIERAIPHTSNGARLTPRLFEFIILFILLFGSILVINGLVDWGLLLIIPIVILIWTFSYFLAKRKIHTLCQKSKLYLIQGIPKKSQEISILLSAGLLIYTLNTSGLGNAVIDRMAIIVNIFPFMNILMILPFVMVILGFLGLGPTTAMVLVGGLLQQVYLPLPPELIVISLTMGSAITIMLSPSTIPLIILSASNGLSIFKNGFKFNLGFTFIFYLFVEVYIQLMLLIYY